MLLHRPRRTVLNPEWKWAVWYPLRRSGKFAQLPADEQRVILAEHGDHRHVVRRRPTTPTTSAWPATASTRTTTTSSSACIGKDLYPLSAIVQTMRKTQQTSLYLERLGPFFVGRALWQSPS